MGKAFVEVDNQYEKQQQRDPAEKEQAEKEQDERDERPDVVANEEDEFREDDHRKKEDGR